MKKVMYGLMVAALSLGFAAPSIAATAPHAHKTAHVVKVAAKKKAAKKKAPAKKKGAATKAPAKKAG